MTLSIIGGGVAGMTAAIYAARSGLNTLIIEKGGFGGQAALTSTIENYPSYKEIEGFELAADMKAQVDALGVESKYGDVTALTKADGLFTITTPSETIEAKAAIIANGVRRRELGIKVRTTARARHQLVRGMRRRLLPQEEGRGHRRGQLRPRRRDLPRESLRGSLPDLPPRLSDRHQKAIWTPSRISTISISCPDTSRWRSRAISAFLR